MLKTRTFSSPRELVVKTCTSTPLLVWKYFQDVGRGRNEKFIQSSIGSRPPSCSTRTTHSRFGCFGRRSGRHCLNGEVIRPREETVLYTSTSVTSCHRLTQPSQSVVHLGVCKVKTLIIMLRYYLPFCILSVSWL